MGTIVHMRYSSQSVGFDFGEVPALMSYSYMEMHINNNMWYQKSFLANYPFVKTQLFSLGCCRSNSDNDITCPDHV